VHSFLRLEMVTKQLLLVSTGVCPRRCPRAVVGPGPTRATGRSLPTVRSGSLPSPAWKCSRRSLEHRHTIHIARHAAAIGHPGGTGETPEDDSDVESLASSLLPERFRSRGKSLLGLIFNAKAPKYAWRTLSACILGGEVLVRILQGKIHWRNTLDQLNVVGPKSLGVCLLTSAFVGMVFTIQFIREFAKLGLTKSVGGVLALALGRELTPVVTCIIIAGRVGSAFAAELGSQQVSEQTDSLRVLGSDPVDYLITPRVLASMIAAPVLNLLCFTMGMAASVFLAEAVYGVSANVILDSASRAIEGWDIIVSVIKSWVFGTIISVISCSWGYTTTGGAKGVGESTTSAVVISLVLIFIADFGLSFLFFQGQGDALKQCM
jgi:ABC transport permease subunit